MPKPPISTQPVPLIARSGPRGARGWYSLIAALSLAAWMMAPTAAPAARGAPAFEPQPSASSDYVSNAQGLNAPSTVTGINVPATSLDGERAPDLVNGRPSEGALRPKEMPAAAAPVRGAALTDGGITEYRIPTFGSSPVIIAAGPDGALWVQ